MDKKYSIYAKYQNKQQHLEFKECKVKRCCYSIILNQKLPHVDSNKINTFSIELFSIINDIIYLQHGHSVAVVLSKKS
jgi:hypothetical protein